MIDIVKFEGEKFNLGFSKIYNLKEFNVREGSDRKFFEDKNVDIILSPEKEVEKDTFNSRNSGLNQVLCNLANKNNIAIGFSFNEIIHSKNIPNTLGRMMQNVFLCRKYKLKTVLGSFANKDIEIKNKSELMSFGKVIGMNGNEIKQSLNFRKKEDLIKILKWEFIQ